MTRSHHGLAPRSRRRRALVWLCTAPIALALLPRRSQAAPLAPGAELPQLVLDDQHGKPLKLLPSTRVIVFSAERAANEMVTRLLSAQPAGAWQRLHGVVVADISAMPGLVTRMFALPKMRELPYAVGLVREPAELVQVADWPRRPGAVTVLRYVDGRLAEIVMAPDEGALRNALGLAP